MKKRQAAYVTLAASLAVSLVGCSPDHEAQPQTKEATIPVQMKPGTQIQFDEKNQMHIVEGGYRPQNNKPQTDQMNIQHTAEGGSVLPKPAPGMRVSYDGTGFPAFIRDNRNMKISTVRTAATVPNLAGQTVYGKFSYFTDVYGERDNILGNYDCATKKGFDEPPYGTKINTRDLDTNLTATLYKRDWGYLAPGVVLDIRPYVFQNVFKESLTKGYINGRYYHN